MKYYITTHSGIQFDFREPTPDMIEIDDIAHHLSNLCRWNGACSRFYSVAQHSILTSRIVPKELQQWALMHDAAEAYVGDMTRPLKHLFPEFKVIEERVMRAIVAKFPTLEWPEPPELARYDDQMQKMEARLYMHPRITLHDRQDAVHAMEDLTSEQVKMLGAMWIKPMSAEAANVAFMARYRKLFLDDDGF